MYRRLEEINVVKTRDEGFPCWPSVIDMAGDRQVDLIVMGTNGNTGLQRFLIGSVTEKLVRLEPYPVLVTRAPDTPGARPGASSD
jgi:nucleotide-binding universal stress UspA family protein